MEDIVIFWHGKYNTIHDLYASFFLEMENPKIILF